MDWNIVLIVLTAGLALWLLTTTAKFLAGPRGEQNGRGRASEQPVDPYHAVAIRTGADGCVAASLLKGRRFLSEEAPLIPLPGCSAPSCACMYVHFSDRRHYERRLGFVDARPRLVGEVPERRMRSGRRKSDFDGYGLA